MTQPLSRCTVTYDQQRAFSLCRVQCWCCAASLRLHSAVWMLQVYESNTERHSSSHVSHCASLFNWPCVVFCVVFCAELYIFVHDLIMFGFLTASLAQRRPEFWEGWSGIVLLYYLWYLRGLLDRGEWGTDTVQGLNILSECHRLSCLPADTQRQDCANTLYMQV